jgi:hypothetical protein
MTANRNPIEVQSESGEARNIEQQALDDASIEPAAVVERGKDYQNAEAIQTDLTAAVDDTESTGAAPQATSQPARDAGSTPQAISQSARKVDAVTKVSDPSGKAEIPALSDEKPADDALIVKFIDPKTGQSKTIGTGRRKTVPGDTEAVVDQESLNRPGGTSDRELDPGKTRDADDKVIAGTEKQLPTGPTGAIQTGAARAGSSRVPADKAGVPQLERQLPEAKVAAIGMGKNGLITKGGTKSGLSGTIEGSMKSGLSGTFDGGRPKNHSSKGGLPVIGGGSRGDSTDDKIHSMLYGHKAHSENSKLGRWLTMKAGENGNDFVLEPDGKGVWELHDDGYWYLHLLDDEEAPAEKKQMGDPIDPDFGMPYTGMSGGTGEKDPFPKGPEEGPDREAGFLRRISTKGMTHRGSGLVGMGSTGNQTFSPDGESDEDDSGRFHGGLFGGDRVLPNNPDDPDYYTPNVLDQGDKAKKASS